MFEHSYDPWKWNVKEEFNEDQLFANFYHDILALETQK